MSMPAWMARQDLETMLSGLDKFQLACSIKCAEVSQAITSPMEEGKAEKFVSELEGLSGCAEHHLAGLKAAKTRNSALLD